MTEPPELRGPKIQRDVALLLRLLWRLEGWGDPPTRSCFEATRNFVGHVGCLETCDCSSCANLVSATKTTAAIIEPHIRALADSHILTATGAYRYLSPEAVESAVYSLLGKYLMTCEEYGGDGPPEEG
jgi:hypothetical protein